jgi:hypothetical protein
MTVPDLNKYVNTTADIVNVVAAHSTQAASIVALGKKHTALRYERRAKMRAEKNLMKDIPKGTEK